LLSTLKIDDRIQLRQAMNRPAITQSPLCGLKAMLAATKIFPL
jgi:hypothetical protein